MLDCVSPHPGHRGQVTQSPLSLIRPVCRCNIYSVHWHFHRNNLHFSNPWIHEVWNSAKMFNCSTPQICENKGWDWSQLNMDSKVRYLLFACWYYFLTNQDIHQVDFAFDSVLAFSDALERCKRDESRGGGLCEVQSQRFFNSYILTTNLTGEGSGMIYTMYGLQGTPSNNQNKTITKKSQKAVFPYWLSFIKGPLINHTDCTVVWKIVFL